MRGADRGEDQRDLVAFDQPPRLLDGLGRRIAVVERNQIDLAAVDAAAVIPELGVKSVKELTALAKEKPDTLSFGSSGTGSSTHLALELYKSLAKVKITHVPYTGSPQVVTDMLAGRIHGYFSPPRPSPATSPPASLLRWP